MTKGDTEIAAVLRTIIDREGPDYLLREPFEVYRELMKGSHKDKKTAAAILYVYVNSPRIFEGEITELSELSGTIQKECSLNKKMADRLATIFVSLYSEDHQKEWKDKENEGLKQFLSEEFESTWEGFAVWEEGNGSVDCHYNADIVLKPGRAILKDDTLLQMLKKNPFTTSETISDYYKKSLCKYLDDEFEEYCTCDDYYQPVVEDFEIEERVNEWSKKNGFKIISCEGDGSDDGYEPKFRSGWY